MKTIKTVLITIFTMVIIFAAVIYFFEIDVFGKNGEQKELTAKEIKELSIDTEVITTNLASAENFAIVRFNILLDSKKAKEELELRTPELREAIITSVASFTKKDLVGDEGIQKLVNKLNERLKNVVKTGKVERILVTEFKLQ